MHPPSPPARPFPPQPDTPQLRSTAGSRPYSMYTSDSPLKRKLFVDEDEGSVGSSAKHARTSSPSVDGRSYHSDEPTQNDEYDELADEDDQHHARSSVSPPAAEARRPSPSQDIRPEPQTTIPPSDGTLVDDDPAEEDREVRDEDYREEASSRAEAEPDKHAETGLDQAHAEDPAAREESDHADEEDTRVVASQKRLPVRRSPSVVEQEEEEVMVHVCRCRFSHIPRLTHFSPALTPSPTTLTPDCTSRSPRRTRTLRLSESLMQSGRLSLPTTRRPGLEEDKVSVQSLCAAAGPIGSDASILALLSSSQS